RHSVTVALILAAVSLIVAGVGLYAIVSQSISRRVREIGVRLGLGMPARHIFLLVLRQAIVPVVAGLLIGLPVSLGLTALVRSQLVGVSPTDPMTFALVAALLLFAASIACWLPLRRALHVDPAQALRHE